MAANLRPIGLTTILFTKQTIITTIKTYQPSTSRLSQNTMKNKKVIKALEDMKRQIEAEEWAVYTNDRGSGSAGVSYIDYKNASAIDGYLHFAETGDNENVPNCNDIYYISVDDFDDEDNEVVCEILECYEEYVKRDEVLGLVVCQEYYDMDYTFYMLHIKG